MELDSITVDMIPVWWPAAYITQLELGYVEKRRAVDFLPQVLVFGMRGKFHKFRIETIWRVLAAYVFVSRFHPQGTTSSVYNSGQFVYTVWVF